MTAIVVTDQSTRAEIAGVLAEANYHAKRKPHVLGCDRAIGMGRSTLAYRLPA
jgi:hypothetical protein